MFILVLQQLLTSHVFQKHTVTVFCGAPTTCFDYSLVLCLWSHISYLASNTVRTVQIPKDMKNSMKLTELLTLIH